MRKYYYKLYEIKFLNFAKIFLRNYIGFILFFAVLSFVLLIIASNQKVLLDILRFNFILLFGVFLSFIVHEYLHIYILKKKDPNGYVEIRFNLMRISIIPKFDITPEARLKVAILPLMILFAAGAILMTVSSLFNSLFLFYTGIIYALHIVNIIPVFGDGAVFLKSLKMIYKDIERR